MHVNGKRFALPLLLPLIVVVVTDCCCCWLLLLLLADWLHCCQKCWAALSGESKAEKEFDANDENAMTNGLDADVDVDADANVAGLAYYGEKWNEMKWNGSCELHTFYWQRAHEWFDNKSENRNAEIWAGQAHWNGTAAHTQAHNHTHTGTHTETHSHWARRTWKEKRSQWIFITTKRRRGKLNQSNRMQSTSQFKWKLL